MSSKSCFACFASGVAAMAAAAIVFGYAWSEYARVTTASTVHKPLLSALARMQQAAEMGDHARLKQNLEQLRKCWDAYAFSGGEPPEQFVARLDQSGSACAESAGN